MSKVEIIKIDPGEHNVIMKNISKGVSASKLIEDKYCLSKNQTKAKTRVACYARISTDHSQQMVSLKTQIAYYTYMILRNPEWEFSGVFADRGLSGIASKNRTEFMRLIEDCRAGKIDMIITKSISRFSRNCIEALEFTRMLKNLPNPVCCYFEKENINTVDEKSDLMISLYGGLAQEESGNISKNVSWGVKRFAQRGIITRRTKTYGYEVDKNNEWSINSEEAKVLRRISEEFLGGKSLTKIANDLHEEGVLSPHGTAWGANQIRFMLKSEKYKGDYLYQKYYHIDVVNNKNKINTGQAPKYYIENHHPAIIEPEVWDQIQNKFEKKSRKPSGSKLEVAGRKSFYKIFTCSECHGIISRHCDEYYKNKKVGSLWRCKNTSERKKSLYCSTFRISEAYIEHNFMSTIQDFKHNIKLREDAEKLISEISLTEYEKNIEIQIKSEIEELNKQLYEAVDQELNKHGQDTRRVDFLTGEILRLIEQQNELKRRNEKAAKYRNEIDWLLKELEKIEYFDPKKETIVYQDEIFERIVERGEIDKDGRINYYYKFGIEHHIDMVYKDYLNMKSCMKNASKFEL